MRIVIKPVGLVLVMAVIGLLGYLAFQKKPAAPGAPPVATTAPSAAPASTGSNLLKPTGDPANWQTEQIDGAALQLKAGIEGELQVTILKGAKEDWKLKVFQSDLDIPAGATVHLHYKARSVPAQSLKVWADTIPGAGKDYHPIWTNWGNTSAYTTEWQEYDFTFVAEKPIPKQSRAPVFPLASATGTLYLKDVVLTVDR